MTHGAFAYFERALKLHDAGKDCFKTLQKWQRLRLLEYEKMGVKKVEILTAGKSSCLKCQALRGKIYTIKEALDAMPIPIKNCDNVYGYCRCLYLPVIE